MRIKVWFYNKISEQAKKYNMFINYECNSEFGIAIMDGNEYVTVSGSLLKETEKAVYMELFTGLFGGSEKNFKTWIPKSVIAY